MMITLKDTGWTRDLADLRCKSINDNWWHRMLMCRVTEIEERIDWKNSAIITWMNPRRGGRLPDWLLLLACSTGHRQACRSTLHRWWATILVIQKDEEGRLRTDKPSSQTWLAGDASTAWDWPIQSLNEIKSVPNLDISFGEKKIEKFLKSGVLIPGFCELRLMETRLKGTITADASIFKPCKISWKEWFGKSQ